MTFNYLTNQITIQEETQISIVMYSMQLALIKAVIESVTYSLKKETQGTRTHPCQNPKRYIPPSEVVVMA